MTPPLTLTASAKMGLTYLRKLPDHLLGDLDALGHLQRPGRLQQDGRLREVGLGGEVQLAVVDRRGERQDLHQAVLDLHVNLRGAEVQTPVLGAVESERSLAVEIREQPVRIVGGIGAREVDRDLPLAGHVQRSRA